MKLRLVIFLELYITSVATVVERMAVNHSLNAKNIICSNSLVETGRRQKVENGNQDRIAIKSLNVAVAAGKEDLMGVNGS